jgi:type VI protein secretion system component VasK
MRLTTRFTDWTLLLTVAATIALIVLAILFFWRPVATGDLAPRWWQAVTMAVLFFGVVALGYRRRRVRSRAALHRALAETRAELAAEARADEPGGARREKGRERATNIAPHWRRRKTGGSERTND